jgi:antirestriction protein
MLNIYLTNLGKYNEGELIGEWVELPATEEELNAALERIGIGSLDEFGQPYEEYFITDYETDVPGVEIGEYDSLDTVNELAETLDGLDEAELEIMGALLNEGYSLEEALDHLEDCTVWYDCTDMTDVAEQYCEETGILDQIPESLRSYFDFEAFGRDLGFSGQFVFTDHNCVEIY